jgi:hypothetical protein
MQARKVITRLKVTNFRGIKALDMAVGEGATIAQGANREGKTSVLNALRAALAAVDIGADAIRHGHDSAEILVDMDHVSVRRAITRKGTSLTVSKDGFLAPKPQSFLSELLGSSPLDPVDLMTLKPKERRAKILEALPCSVTREQLLTWCPELPADLDVSGHGLEVIERARKLVYDQRTHQNSRAKDAAEEARRARGLVGDVTAVLLGPSVAAATEALADASRLNVRIGLRIEQAAEQTKKSERAREAIARKRDAAKQLRDNADKPVETSSLLADMDRYSAKIADLRAQLASVEAAHTEVVRAHERAERSNSSRAASMRDAVAHEDSALELERSLADQTVTAPTSDEIAAVRNATIKAQAELAQAHGAEALRKQLQAALDLEAKAAQEAGRATLLDAWVKALTNDAPRAIAATDSVPGLTLEGDDVLLDGTSLDALSGAEQMRLCVQIAKRASAKGKFLVVDGLERLDVDQFQSFIKEATADSWQLVASRVTSGALEFLHLTAD